MNVDGTPRYRQPLDRSQEMSLKTIPCILLCLALLPIGAVHGELEQAHALPESLARW